MKPLVTVINNQAVTTSEIIAEGVGNQHKNVLELIRQNIDDLQEFGQVAFETRAGYNNSQVTVALLNEQQTTLLLTYMRNNDVVRSFKKELVKAFFGMANRLQTKTSPDKSITDAAKMLPPIIRAAKALGLDKNAAAISANQLVNRLTNVNLLNEFGHTHLIAENQDNLYFTPSELGKRIDCSAQKFNTLLEKASLQTKKGKAWIPTPSAKGLYRLFDTSKQHSDGVPVQQIKWSDAVLHIVK